MSDDNEQESELQKNSMAERVSGWLKGFGGPLAFKRRDDDLREMLAGLIEEQPDGEHPMAPEYHLLNNIVQLKERTVADCMCPRADIVSVDAAMPFAELVKFVRKEEHSRYPVHRGQLDDVIGMIHLKDVMAALVDGKTPTVDSMLRNVLYVPTTMPVMKLLMQLRARQHNMAIAVDEYGGTDGLITIEDLVEQIVGEIEDEHDETDYSAVQVRGDGALVVDARMPLDHLIAQYPAYIALKDADSETVNGLILSLHGSVPARGAQLAHPGGWRIDVLDADSRRVRRIRLGKAAGAV